MTGTQEKGYRLDATTQANIGKVFQSYLKENHKSDITGILLSEELNLHYAVVVDCSALLKVETSLADVLFYHCDEVLQFLDDVLRDVQRDVYESISLKRSITQKPNVHVRIKNFPVCPELWRDRIPKSRDIGKFLAVAGTVIRTSSVKVLEYKKDLTCSKCQRSFDVEADFEQCYRIPTPSRCPMTSTCNSKEFIMTTKEGSSSNRKCKDFQTIRIQEQIRKLAMGTIPRAVTVVLEDDLVDDCKPGDDVIIYGIVKCRWQPSSKGKVYKIEKVLKANYVEVQSEQRLGASVKEEMQNDFECFWAAHADTPLTARNHILSSLCPQVYGLYVVKLAVALVLAGGVARTDSSGSRVRGEAHLLLVGDPGTGKSQFLRYAAKITPRSVLTTGIGSTSAGLTVTAIRDGPHWTLEAGALVLADGGVCCIDEFSSIKEHDRGAIHEAMEQQTVSVAKAGLVCKLNTRTSILAATNPKLGRYDETASMDLNIAIASPLLSRFDIVLVLLDSRDEAWDSVVTDYMLTGKDTANSGFAKQKLWSMDQMQAYFCVVKQINPVLSDSANRILSEYYRHHRKSDFRNAARTTIRLLKSLIRIAEAHARLMYHRTVEVMDAVAAVTIMESSMQGSSLLSTDNILHSCFPTDPESEYKSHVEAVLNKLGLNDIFQKEMEDSSVQAGAMKNDAHFIPREPLIETKTLASTVQEIVTRRFGTQRPSCDEANPQNRFSNRLFANETFRQDDDISFDQFGKGLHENEEFVAKTSTQHSPPKKLQKIHPKSSVHDRLQCFRRATPDSSPETDIRLSGIIKGGHQKRRQSSVNNSRDEPCFFGTRPRSENDTASISIPKPNIERTNKIGNENLPQGKTPNSLIFSLDESIGDDLFRIHRPNVESVKKMSNENFPQKKKPKSSIFSLDESIGDDLFSIHRLNVESAKEIDNENFPQEKKPSSSIFSLDESIGDDLFRIHDISSESDHHTTDIFFQRKKQSILSLDASAVEEMMANKVKPLANVDAASISKNQQASSHFATNCVKENVPPFQHNSTSSLFKIDDDIDLMGNTSENDFFEF